MSLVGLGQSVSLLVDVHGPRCWTVHMLGQWGLASAGLLGCWAAGCWAGWLCTHLGRTVTAFHPSSAGRSIRVLCSGLGWSDIFNLLPNGAIYTPAGGWWLVGVVAADRDRRWIINCRPPPLSLVRPPEPLTKDYEQRRPGSSLAANPLSQRSRVLSCLDPHSDAPVLCHQRPDPTAVY